MVDGLAVYLYGKCPWKCPQKTPEVPRRSRQGVELKNMGELAP